MKLWKKFVTKCYVIKLMIYSYFICPLFFDKNYKKVKDTIIKGKVETAEELASTNKSIGRYGDGEFSWIFGKHSGVENFQKGSKELSKRLLEVLQSNQKNFMIALPDAISNIDDRNFTKQSLRFWKYFFTNKSKKISKIIDKNRTYYNANVTRAYIDYNSNKYVKDTINSLKKVWNNKKVLIIEGSQTRLGYNDDLLENCKVIKRIECPVTNAFDSYEKIFSKSMRFLENNSDYITLISLGPTATILAYDLFMKGHRAIDIGNIDVEYEWYLIGAKDKINLPDKYVNEVQDGKESENLVDHSHDDEIICKI